MTIKKINNGNWRLKDRIHLTVGLLFMAIALGTIGLGLISTWSIFAVGAGVTAVIEGAVGVGIIALAFEEVDPKKGKYCPACGDQYSPKTTQQGYNYKTGARLTETHWTCMNASCKSKPALSPGVALAAAALKNAYPSTTSSISYTPFLSNATWQGTVSFAQPCHDPRSTRCGSCLDGMVADGIFTEEQANLLR